MAYGVQHMNGVKNFWFKLTVIVLFEGAILPGVYSGGRSARLGTIINHVSGQFCAVNLQVHSSAWSKERIYDLRPGRLESPSYVLHSC